MNKEFYTPPETIAEERKRLEEATGRSDTFVLQFLISVYGGIDVANYLKWEAERKIDERSSGNSENKNI
jgi:hypothetical protein